MLGWSAFAQRRTLPALARLGMAHIDVASRSRTVTLPAGITGEVFNDYGAALRSSTTDWVYVSTRNTDHFTWAARALESGRHVIVDKPAALSLADVERLVTLATKANRLVAEATVYAWHPQIEQLRQIASDAGPVTTLVATFSFPPLPPTDFRWQAAQGGGALWDLGPYAITPGRIFFGEAPTEVIARVSRRDGDEVETAFTAMLRYSGGRSVIGHFGMTTAYVNRLTLLGPNLEATVDRAFTTAPDQPALIRGQQHGRPIATEVGAADAFSLFLADAFAAPAAGRQSQFADWMLDDARCLERLRASALTQPGV